MWIRACLGRPTEASRPPIDARGRREPFAAHADGGADHALQIRCGAPAFAARLRAVEQQGCASETATTPKSTRSTVANAAEARVRAEVALERARLTLSSSYRP
jgi:hypothetical protein